MAHPLTNFTDCTTDELTTAARWLIPEHLDRARQLAGVSPDAARYHIGAAQTLALCEIVKKLDRIARQLEQ